jgi:hypothetical protein
MSENMELRKIFGPSKKEGKGRGRKLYKKEFRGFFS